MLCAIDYPSIDYTSVWSENHLAKITVGLCYDIHVKLGPGLLESVYEEILCYELENSGLQIERQKGIPVLWKGKKMGVGFRSDIVVLNKLIIEVKSIDVIAPVHPKILLTYLRLTDIKLGLLVNFNEKLIKNGITRVVNNL